MWFCYNASNWSHRKKEPLLQFQNNSKKLWIKSHCKRLIHTDIRPVIACYHSWIHNQVCERLSEGWLYWMFHNEFVITQCYISVCVHGTHTLLDIYKQRTMKKIGDIFHLIITDVRIGFKVKFKRKMKSSFHQLSLRGDLPVLSDT